MATYFEFQQLLAKNGFTVHHTPEGELRATKAVSSQDADQPETLSVGETRQPGGRQEMYFSANRGGTLLISIRADTLDEAVTSFSRTITSLMAAFEPTDLPGSTRVMRELAQLGWSVTFGGEDSDGNKFASYATRAYVIEEIGSVGYTVERIVTASLTNPDHVNFGIQELAGKMRGANIMLSGLPTANFITVMPKLTERLTTCYRVVYGFLAGM